MEVITKKRLVLVPHTEEFEYSFAWNKKRGVVKDFWFTTSGKCKIWVGALHNEVVGSVEPEEYKELVKQLKKNKCVTFIWGSDYYTVSGDNDISEVRNMGAILYQARNEWTARNGWKIIGGGISYTI
jgi:hypothetical protein